MLKLVFKDSSQNEPQQDDEFEFRSKPFANSEVYRADIDSFERLTKGDDVKTVYSLKITTKDIDCDFLPGDAIAIFPQNDEDEVNELLVRLNALSVCDRKYCLEVGKKNAFKHIPQRGTLRRVFTDYVNIRSVPKKVFLKKLLIHTTDEEERQTLENCLSAGSNQYDQLILENRTLLQLLNRFPSCRAPVELILEYSAPLLPRFFSIASSPLEKDTLGIIFSVVRFENGLKGVCTGWLEKIIQKKATKVSFYFRKPTNFRIDNLDEQSRIFVATGTGISPFLGFLRYKASSAKELQKTWLYYGCRYNDRDFLCSDELKRYLKDGILTGLYTAFSRDTTCKYYVEKELLKHQEDLVDLILNKGALVYVCGDGNTVVKGVNEAVIECIAAQLNIDSSEAAEIFNTLIENKKYLIDCWV